MVIAVSPEVLLSFAYCVHLNSKLCIYIYVKNKNINQYVFCILYIVLSPENDVTYNHIPGCVFAYRM